MMMDWVDHLDLFEQNRVEEASRHLTGNREGVSAGGEVEGGRAASGEIAAPARSTIEQGREPPAAQGSALRLPAVVLSHAGLPPELSDLQRERMEMLQIYDAPQMLPAADFAKAAGKSRRWISYEIQDRKFLALGMGNRGHASPTGISISSGTN